MLTISNTENNYVCMRVIVIIYRVLLPDRLEKFEHHQAGIQGLAHPGKPFPLSSIISVFLVPTRESPAIIRLL